MADEQGYGQLQPWDLTSDFNRHAFQIWQTLARCRTNVLVVVKSVTAGSGTPPTPSVVSAQVLVNMVDGNNNSRAHGTIYNIPVLRIQGGGNALICDPAVGDVGLMAVCDRDISAVQANGGKASNPGSQRRFDLADGVYLGSLFGAAPTQYIEFLSSGITITSPVVATTGNLSVGTGATGSFTTPTGQVVTVIDGIVTNIF